MWGNCLGISNDWNPHLMWGWQEENSGSRLETILVQTELSDFSFAARSGREITDHWFACRWWARAVPCYRPHSWENNMIWPQILRRGGWNRGGSLGLYRQLETLCNFVLNIMLEILTIPIINRLKMFLFQYLFWKNNFNLLSNPNYSRVYYCRTAL